MKNKIFLIFIFCLMLTSFTSAVCTVDVDKVFPLPYYSGETITATQICDDVTEKSKAYTLTWAYENGTVLETDVGITPDLPGDAFFDTFTTTGITGVINATLTGSNLEGFDQANITAQKSNALFITNAQFSPTAFLGSLFSVEFEVRDVNDKLVNNAYCSIYGTDVTNSPLQICGNTNTIDGHGQCDAILNNEVFNEGSQYLARIRCICGSNETQCFDEDGLAVSNSAGSNNYPFTASKWITANTITNKDSYIGREEMFICANLTNSEYDKRIPVEIYHQVRCSRGEDNDFDDDRALIFTDDGMPDERGVGVNTTQMQCKRFIIPEISYLQGTTSTCYASTSVWVLNDNREKIKGYTTSSPPFNLTITDINIDPDWQLIEKNIFNTIINLSEERYDYLQPTSMGNLDIRLDKDYIESIRAEDQYFKYPQNIDNFVGIENIKSVIALDVNGNVLDSVIEVLDDGNVEVEIIDIDFVSDGWVNVTMVMNNFEERQSSSLEGIMNSSQVISKNLDDDLVGYIRDIGNSMEQISYKFSSGEVNIYDEIQSIKTTSAKALSIIANDEVSKDDKLVWIVPISIILIIIVLIIFIIKKKRKK